MPKDTVSSKKKKNWNVRNTGYYLKTKKIRGNNIIIMIKKI